MNKEKIIKRYIRNVILEDKNFVDEYPLHPQDNINPAEERPRQLPKRKNKNSYYNVARRTLQGLGIVGIIAGSISLLAQKADNNPTPENVAAIKDVLKKVETSPEDIDLEKINKTLKSGSLSYSTNSNVDNVENNLESPITLNIPEYNDNEAFQFMLEKEEFKASPYVDKTNISIGYGSNIDRNGKKGKSSQYTFAGKKKSASMLKATKLALKSYGISRVPTSSKITKAEALKIAKIAWKDHKQNLFSIDPWVQNLPGPILEVCVDMGYNVGAGVFNDFEELGKHLKKASKSYQSFNESNNKEHLLPLIKELKDAIKELKNSKAYKSTKKARDNYLEAHPNAASWDTRFERHIKKVEGVINTIESALKVDSTQQNESYSLKSVYNNLFS